jgi:hypothetical protein
MSGSPMYQEKQGTDIELTVEYEKGKKKMAENRQDPNMKKDYEKQTGISIDAPTGTATPNLPMHTVERAGSFLREYDSKRNVVKEVPWNSMREKGGEAAEKLTKAVEIRNADVKSRQTRNAELYNAMGGGTAPENLNEKQKQSLVGLGKAVVVNAPAKQRMKAGAKMPPAKQVSKKAFKKPATTSTTTKPKASKAPTKQLSYDFGFGTPELDQIRKMNQFGAAVRAKKQKAAAAAAAKPVAPAMQRSRTGLVGKAGSIKGGLAAKAAGMAAKAGAPTMQMSKLKKKSC